MPLVDTLLVQHMHTQVAFAIAEDVDSGDITAQLIPDDHQITEFQDL